MTISSIETDSFVDKAGREVLQLSHHSPLSKHWHKLLTSNSIDNAIVLIQKNSPSLNSIEEIGATGKEMMKTVAPDAAVSGVFGGRRLSW